MSLRNSFIPLVDTLRGLLGPVGFDLTTYQVSIVTRTWSGTKLHAGTPTDETLVLPQQLPVLPIQMHEIAASSGDIRMGDILVDGITPTDGNGVGFSPTQLRPTITGNNQERVYQVTGPDGVMAEYALVELRTYKPFTWSMVLRRRSTIP